MTPFVLTRLARRDLEEIWDCLAADHRDVAERVLNGIEAAIVKLTRTPGIGHLREDLADRRHRFFLVYTYLIVYRPGTQPLEIIRVLHASRDIRDLLSLHAEEP
jgi:plasmid stabilization system protein ParE